MPRKDMNIIIEELSHIEFESHEEDTYTLWDKIRDGKYKINKTAYEICLEIDGIKSLKEITEVIANSYEIDYKHIVDDVYELYSFLKKNKLIICKNTIAYRFYKLYNRLAFIN